MEYVTCVGSPVIPYSYSLSNTVINTSLCTFSQSYQTFQAQLSTIQELVSYTQACKHDEWINVMQQELNALEANKI